MAGPNAEASANDTGIPADMLADNEIGAEPKVGGDVTGLAARLGWKPKEEWRGDETKWLDASDYIGEFEREAPKLKERTRTQKEMLAQLADRQRKQDEMMAEIIANNRELVENQRNANARGFEYRRSELDAAIERASAEADAPTVKRLLAERDALDKMRPATPAQRTATAQPGTVQPGTQPQLSPAVQQFMRDNPWFGFERGKDRAMSGYATNLNAEIAEENPHWTEDQQLAEVRRQMEKKFPERFENPARRAAAAVTQPGAQQARVPSKPKGKTVADLDEHGKAALAKFKRTIPGFTDKDFLDSYKWDDKS